MLLQILNYDIYYLYSRVLKPAVRTLSVDEQQLASEVINRLRYTVGTCASPAHVSPTLPTCRHKQ
jgi:hypothetical protein